MRVAIVGSRDFHDLDAVRAYVAALPAGATVISGGARGVDSTAEQAARARGLKVETYPADWDEHGKSAGMIRNATIARRCDRLVAFWDGKSKGTKNTILRARNFGKPVEIIKAGRQA